MPEYLFSIQIIGVFLFGNPVMLVIDRKHAAKLMPQHFLDDVRGNPLFG